MRQTLQYLTLALILSLFMAFGSQMLAGMLGANASSDEVRYLSTALAVLGPTLAAVILIRWNRQSPRKWLFRDLREARLAWWWLAVPATTLLTTLVGFRLAGAGAWENAHANWSDLVLLFGFSILVVGILEETGWRGWLLRHWLSRAAPLSATLVVAAAWAVWHLPKLLSGLEMALAMVILCFAHSTILTWLWSRLQGRTLLAALTHGSVNAPILWLETQLDPVLAFRGFMYVIGLYGLFALALIGSNWKWWRTNAAESGPDREARGRL